jgi:hypothetical protein
MGGGVALGGAGRERCRLALYTPAAGQWERSAMGALSFCLQPGHRCLEEPKLAVVAMVTGKKIGSHTAIGGAHLPSEQVNIRA